MIKLYSIVTLLVFSQGIYSQVSSSLFDEIENKPTEVKLLPESMIFTQRLLWGEKGLMRKTDLFSLSIESREREMKIRRGMLTAHQLIGYATLLGMISQGITGVQLYNGNRRVKDLHKSIGAFTTASYFTGAGLSLFAPPPLVSIKSKGLNSIKAHRWLATVHFSSMIATNLLSESNKSYHRAASFTLFGSYALAILSFKF
ncbi:MAG: hypothetical protein ACPG6F_00810 [Flavobacteriaceae bacterium]|jgi:hypothetical protein